MYLRLVLIKVYFVLTGCDDEKYWDGPHVEAGKCAYRKNEFVLKFVGEWFGYACNENIITDLPHPRGPFNPTIRLWPPGWVRSKRIS